MVLRMEGKGNMGTLMAEMMAGVKAPRADDTKAIIAYLSRHAQTPLDPARYPEVNQPAGEAFRVACNQCHVLPDPQRYTAGAVARGGGAHAEEHGVDEPRGRARSRCPASRSCASRRSTPSWRSTRENRPLSWPSGRESVMPPPIDIISSEHVEEVVLAASANTSRHTSTQRFASLQRLHARQVLGVFDALSCSM